MPIRKRHCLEPGETEGGSAAAAAGSSSEGRNCHFHAGVESVVPTAAFRTRADFFAYKALPRTRRDRRGIIGIRRSVRENRPVL